MTSEADILAEVQTIFRTRWSKRNGLVVPDASDIQLGNDGVTLSATILYADMADSTHLVSNYSDTFAAEVYKAFLISAVRIIRNHEGVVTAFDGDRVMAVFIGTSKNTDAVKCGLRINYATKNLVNKALKEIYPNTTFQVGHAVGIDTGEILVARTGIRNANDLVWVGRAANIAAKLCSLRDTTYSTFITDTVYQNLHESARFGGTPARSMWERITWAEQNQPVHRSNWWWSL
jgi:class 3 adenylate cyclase